MCTQPPYSQSSLSPEDALFRVLDAGMRVRLTVILVPDCENGRLSGESGALSLPERWAGSRGFPVKWLALTSADAQPDAFLDRLERALDGLIHLERAPDWTSEDRLTDLVNAILDVPMDFALVIFGYGAIESQDVHSLMGRILDYQPPQMHLYLIVPTMPPLLCLPRMRARRQLLEATPGCTFPL